MKLPLQYERCALDNFALEEADRRIICYIDDEKDAQALVALANAHAAVPGPPREDGVWIIQTHNGNEYIAKARTKINDRWYWECGVNYVRDEDIMAHRKHIPLEVTHAS